LQPKEEPTAMEEGDEGNEDEDEDEDEDDLSEEGKKKRPIKSLS